MTLIQADRIKEREMKLASVGSFPSGIGITPVEKRQKLFNYKKMGDANAKKFHIPKPVVTS